MRTFLYHRRPGFLLLEVLLGMSVFMLFLTAVGAIVLRGQENTMLAGDRTRGLYAVGRMIEGARSMRDGGNFSSLAAGTYGVIIGPSGTWQLSGSSVTLSGGYLTQLTITVPSVNKATLVATTRWKHGRFQTGTVSVRSELTNWRGAATLGDWSSPSLEGSVIDAGTPLYNAVAVRGNYAYVVGDATSGGPGLSIFDISSTSSPTRVNSGFSLGTSGYGVAIRGSSLYIVTGSSTEEVREYSLTSPTAPSLVTSYNMSGSSLARSIAISGPYLYIGTTQDASYDEFVSFDITASGSILYRDSLNIDATINGIAISQDDAYISTSDGSGEMQAVNISNPLDLALTGSGTYNITSTEAGRGIAVSGTAALLGRTRGAIQEMVLINGARRGGPPLPSPGPWYHEGSGSLVGVAISPSKCYAFLAADSSGKAFQVVNLLNTASLPELYSYNSTSGTARGVYYDPLRDRAYLLTRKGFLIFRPVGAGTCS